MIKTLKNPNLRGWIGILKEDGLRIKDKIG